MHRRSVLNRSGTGVRSQSLLRVRLAGGQSSRSNQRHSVVRFLLGVLGPSSDTSAPRDAQPVYDVYGGLQQSRRRVSSRLRFADRESPSLGPHRFEGCCDELAPAGNADVSPQRKQPTCVAYLRSLFTHSCHNRAKWRVAIPVARGGNSFQNR